MQINSSINSSLQRLPTTGQSRSSIAEPQSHADNAIVAASSRPSSSVIQSVLSQRQNDNQRNSEILERNPRNRMALQSYFENGPTLEQQLDVDLAGIDTYV